ncbi:SIS domain-containing protein [Curtobacterium flaccumfaciens]|nr:SIS domain-containing protein [Curtobacterium flaccumfaciens]
MAKEIGEQADVVATILDRVARRTADGSMWVGLGLAGFHRLAIVACGTSLNAGQVIATALRGIGGVPTDIVVASEADQAVLGPGTLVVAISQSGETADVLRALDRFEDRHPVLALTNNMHSSLARRADAVLDCHAGPEIGVAATKTFTAQVVVGVAAMIAAMVASGRIEPSHAQVLVDELLDLPARIEHAARVSAERMPLLASERQGGDRIPVPRPWHRAAVRRRGRPEAQGAQLPLGRGLPRR